MSRRVTPSPPRRLRAAARRAWCALAPKLLAAGLYLPIDAPVLEALCATWCTAERLRARLGAAGAPERSAWRAAYTEWRLAARELAAKFLVLDARRIHVAELDAEDRDIELARIFDPSRPLRRVRLSPTARQRLEEWNARARAAGLLPGRGA